MQMQMQMLYLVCLHRSGSRAVGDAEEEEEKEVVEEEETRMQAAVMVRSWG